MINEQATHFRDVGLLKLAVDIAEGRLVGNERQHAIMLEIAELLPKAPVFRWGVSLLTDMASEAELSLPRWMDGIDPSSSLTVMQVQRSAKTGLPVNPLTLRSFVHPVRVLPGVSEILAAPPYTDLVMPPDLGDRIEKRQAEWERLQDMIESDKTNDDPAILQEQRLLLEHLVEEDDTESEAKPEKDQSGEAEPA